jgi:hypothetical protein
MSLPACCRQGSQARSKKPETISQSVDKMKFFKFAKTRFKNKKGQATTEVVLFFPILLLILFFTAKIFALLVIVQKLEIGSYYAARRWQLESHRSLMYQPGDEGLRVDIKNKVDRYLGLGTSFANFLQLYSSTLTIERTQVWNILTLKVYMTPAKIPLLCKYPSSVVCVGYGEFCYKGYNYMCTSGAALEVIKYVPNRDMPLRYELPGLVK